MFHKTRRADKKGREGEGGDPEWGGAVVEGGRWSVARGRGG